MSFKTTDGRIFDGNTIYPTGTCFDDALEYLEKQVRSHCVEQLGHLRLVHGVMTAPDGEGFSHAWVEDEEKDEAIFCGLLPVSLQRVYVAVDRQEYHRLVTELTYYTIEEAWEKNAQSGHFGPWLEKYQLLCGTGRSCGI